MENGTTLEFNCEVIQSDIIAKDVANPSTTGGDINKESQLLSIEVEQNDILLECDTNNKEVIVEENLEVKTYIFLSTSLAC